MIRSLTKNFISSGISRLFTIKRDVRSNSKQMNQSLVASDKKKNKKEENFFGIVNINHGNKLKKFRLPFKLKNEEKKFSLKGNSVNLSNELDNADPEELVKYSEDLDLYAQNENLFHQKIVDEDMKNKKKAKIAIVKKKINKIEGLEENNFNLLTWDAKEQIKHLHINDPQTWTVEKISESFPITVESCKKLLKSKWTPKTLIELEKHDEKVMRNWKLLEKIENNPNSAGPAVNIYDQYKKSNKLHLLKNAAGLATINFERKSHIFSDSYSVHESLLCKAGDFSKIIIHKDNSIKKIFNRHVENEHDKKSSLKENTTVFEQHLITTKSQLSKSINKIFSVDEKENSKS